MAVFIVKEVFMLRTAFLVLALVLSACALPKPMTSKPMTPEQRAIKLSNQKGYFSDRQLQNIRQTYAGACEKAGFQLDSDVHDRCMAMMYYDENR